MAYIHLVLTDYALTANIEGIVLAKTLFDEKGYLRSSWKSAFTVWVNDLADSNGLTPGIFRECWIEDALENSKPYTTEGTLHYIRENLWVEEELTDTCVICGDAKPHGVYGDDERFMCDECFVRIRKQQQQRDALVHSIQADLRLLSSKV